MEEIARALGFGRRVLVGALFAGAFALVAGCAAEPEVSADLVLRNGKVVTVDAAVPDGEAIAVQGDKILAGGSDAEIAQYIGSGTKVIDLEGQLAIPGFIEAHGHFLGVGDAKMQLDLMRRRARSSAVAAGTRKSGTRNRPATSKACPPTTR